MKHEYPMHRKKSSKLLKMSRKEARYLKSLLQSKPVDETGFMVREFRI